MITIRKVILIIWLINLVCVNALAATSAEYRLTNEMFNQVVISAENNNYTVKVIVKDPFREDLEKLLSSSVGQNLRIFHNNNEIGNSVIGRNLEFGELIVGTYSNKEEAVRKLEQLTSDWK